MSDVAQAAQEATAAIEAAQARASAILSERSGLEMQLLQLQGDTAAIRAIERAAMDETNRALYDRVAALQDEQASQAAAQAAQAAASQQAERAAADLAAEHTEILAAIHAIAATL